MGCFRSESQLHLFQCRHYNPFWSAILSFITSLGTPQPHDRLHALIFGLYAPNKLGPSEARATTRHAFRELYRDVTRVDQEGRAFIWQCTFERTLLALRDALLKHPFTLKRREAHTTFSTRGTHYMPTEDADAFFPSLISLDPSGTYMQHVHALSLLLQGHRRRLHRCQGCRRGEGQAFEGVGRPPCRET